MKDIHHRFEHMSFGKDNFIGLRFFDAIRIEAKSDSGETTGDLSLYTHLTVSEVLGSYHEGALAPLYIGIVVVGQHRSHTFRKSAFPWYQRVPMVKIWGSSKNDQNWTTGKL